MSDCCSDSTKHKMTEKGMLLHCQNGYGLAAKSEIELGGRPSQLSGKMKLAGCDDRL